MLRNKLWRLFLCHQLVLIIMASVTHSLLEGDKCSADYCAVDTSLHNCFCDELCHVYGDCCNDASNASLSTIPLEPARFTCVRDVHFKNALSNESFSDRENGIYVINTCQSNWTTRHAATGANKKLLDLCEKTTFNAAANFQDNLLITQYVFGADNLLYKNRFCALCNFQTFQATQFNISCSREYNASHFDVTKPLPANCKLSFTSAIPPRQCKAHPFDIVSDCPQDYLNRNAIENRYKLPKMLKRTMVKKEYNLRLARRARCLQNGNAFRYYRNSTSLHYKVFKNQDCASCNSESPILCSQHTINDAIVNYFPYSFLLDMKAMFLLRRRYEALMSTTCDANFYLHNVNDEVKCLPCANVTSSRAIQSMENSTLACQQSIAQPMMTSNLLALFIKNQNAQIIFTLICISLSVTALTVHIMVYVCIPSLLNRPGLLIMSLSVTLLLAQISFLLMGAMPLNTFACKCIGVATYVTFLAYFLWTQIVSFDIWLTFNGVGRASEASRWRLKKYYCYVIVISVCLGTMSILFDNITTSSSSSSSAPFSSWRKVRPSFGQPSCWFNNEYGLLIFFALPVALILFSNMLLFGAAMHSLRKLSHLHKDVQFIQNRTRAMLCVKLFSLSGITWIITFVASVGQNAVLHYLAIFLNGTQGLFICCSFVMTKQVHRIATERLSSWSKFVTLFGGSFSNSESSRSGAVD